MTRDLTAVDLGKTEASSSSQSATNDASFASVLGNVASGAVNSLKSAESMSFAGIKGTASTREVVDAVMEAQQTLQTAIAIRDKVVSAFLDVTRMQM
jgi:flagellar hook-basal body complex protein FliE